MLLRITFASISFFSIFGSISNAFAASAELASIEKVAVFPVDYQGERGDRVDEATAKSLDETWWQVRDELTQTGRFAVASRAFLQKADAFQPRAQLSVSDAVILGRYVEADALLTLELRERTLTVSVFSSADGMLAWSEKVSLHPSILIREQISKVARGLVREFIAQLPYQGVTTQDSFSKQAVFEQGGKKHVRVRTAASKIAVGDPVEWISINRLNMEPIFQGGTKVEVKAEGVVQEVLDQAVIVELTRVRDGRAIRSGTLVNFPLELKRQLQASKSTAEGTSAAVVSLLATGAGGAAIEAEAKQAERRSDESGPVAATLSFLGSLAVILLLAF